MCIARRQVKLPRAASPSRNNPVAARQLRSAVIAIFAKPSTLVRSVIIIPLSHREKSDGSGDRDEAS
jgi:hypothetical protein